MSSLTVRYFQGSAVGSDATLTHIKQNQQIKNTPTDGDTQLM